jgi:hypothetical protein
MTNQPKWKCIANLGDATPWDYGGKFLMVDQTGVYCPELWIWMEAPDDCKEEYWTEYRVLLERCTYVDGVLSDNKFHPELEVWFASELEQVAKNDGHSKEELIDGLCSADSVERAWAYLALIDYHGVHEFDSYPNSYTDRGLVMRKMNGWTHQISEVNDVP